MSLLPSGLPDTVGDEEDLARYLTSSSQRSATMVKLAAFMPSPVSRQTSVFRHGRDPRESLWEMARVYALGHRPLHGAAIVSARHVRDALLEVAATEPPPRHAAIVGWPEDTTDSAMEKARWKECASVLAQYAALVLNENAR